MNLIGKFLTSYRFFALLLFVTAFFLALATFIENDFGTERAKALIYNAWWFELVLALIAVNLLAIIFTKKLYKLKKFPVFLFHFAFVIMLIGAAITRYFGYEGTMHIRKNEETNVITTQDKGLNIEEQKTKQQLFFKQTFEQLKSVNKNFTIHNQKFNIKTKNYYPNAYPKAVEDTNGKPIIGFIVSSNGYQNFSYISLGQKQNIDNFTCSFGDTTENTLINFFIKNDSIYLLSKQHTLWVAKRKEKSIPFPPNTPTALIKNNFYQLAGITLIPKEVFSKAKIIPQAMNDNKISEVAELTITKGDKKQDIQLWKNIQNIENKAIFDSIILDFSYGKRMIQLPFSIYLENFEIKRYPGSNSPSSFDSYVIINQENKPQIPFHIYMNNILKINGFRFFQSSYDTDEQGTILSVNYDVWGTRITYIGYFLLFLGILLSLLSKNTVFRSFGKISKTLYVLLFILGINTHSFAHKDLNLQNISVSKQHAEKFGKLLIQDNSGRTEPINTFASDILRKLARSQSIYELNAIQIFLEMHLDPIKWSNIPIIKIKNKQLRKFLDLPIEYASYNHFVLENGNYILQNLVNDAYEKPSAKRSKFDKEVIKVDERVNICYAIFNGSYLKIFPQKNLKDNSNWLTLEEINKNIYSKKDSAQANHLLRRYFENVAKAKKNNNYLIANNLIDSLKIYQKTHSNYDLPSEHKVKAELIYYKWNIFKKLFPFYLGVGIVFLMVLVIGIIRNVNPHKSIIYTFYSILLLGFIIHTLGIITRWYISGHAPMSNGYESMIFISWATLLAGFLFSKKSSISLSATALLSGLTLMVANLSFMDPVITNLVPVLQSYWLTLHVSVISGSYAFLGLGFLLGIINQVLFIAQNSKNKKHLIDTTKNLSEINHKTLILGLYFLTIGTFLGAIWANESWGRYWGWDPKETWSLITIIVYTFVTHSYMIPGFKGVFIFNTLSIYGISSVLMTYFGVNYYLSGMHSYAGGDPIPIPFFVYAIIIFLILLSTIAWNRVKKNWK